MDYRIEQLRFQLREDPASRVFYQLGELLRRAGEREEAISVLERGLAHHPEYVAAWVSLGRTLFEVERYTASAEALTRALELDPENAVAAQMLGRCGVRRGDWEQAVRGFSLAVELIPGDDELVAELEAARAHLAPEEPSGEEGPPPRVEEPREEASPPVEESGDGDSGAAAEAQAAWERPREVVVVSEEDPFAAGPTGDTGVFLAADDVFGAAAAPEEPREPRPAGAEEAAPPAAEPTRPIAVPGPPAEAESGGGEPGEAAAAGELPLPTVTLARLALEQGDLDLARETARAVLERDPDSEAAAALLEEIGRARTPAAPAPAEARIRRLERWLAGIRRAAEMRST